MREVLNKLERVQELDLQINAILKKKAEFPERLAGLQAEIASTSAKFEEKKKIVDELERNRRQQLGALELNEERAKRSQEKLEQIKTNQEFGALQKEIESLKKNSTVIQDNASKVTEELDRHKKELETHESALKELNAKLQSETAKISEETKSFDTELAKLQGQRKDAIVGIDTRFLNAYDKVRQGRNGMGLAPAVAGSCRGCNMRIPPQIYNELQRGTEMFTCPSCRRILVYKDGRGAESSATANT